MKTVILISGWKRAGKDTLASRILRRTDAARVRFAQTLKSACASMLGVAPELFETQDKRRWRSLLIGVGAAAREFDQDIFANAGLREALSRPEPTIVIPDLRFRNEVEVFERAAEKGALRLCKVRVERVPYPLPLSNQPSERDLDHFGAWDLHARIREGDLKAFDRLADDIVEKLKLPPRACARPRVYLMGGMEFAPDGGHDWRRKATALLAKRGWTVYDPCVLEAVLLSEQDREALRLAREDDRALKQALVIMRSVVQPTDRSALLNSTAGLCLWDEAARAGGGTHAEMEAASLNGVSVVVVARSSMPLWTQSNASVVIDAQTRPLSAALAEAVERLDSLYGGGR